MKRWIVVATVWGSIVGSSLRASAGEIVYEASPSDQAPSYWTTYDERDLQIEELVEEEVTPSAQPYEQGTRPPHAAPFQYVPPVCCTDETPLQQFRRSAYQGSTLSGGVIGDSGRDALTISHYELATRFALPIDGMENVLLISPYFREDSVDAPAGIDIPDSLYQTGVSFTWLKTLSPRWKATTIVSPSVRSDFQTGEDAFRIFGLGMLTHRYTDTLDLSFGAVYLDRDDIPVLPVLGFKWVPTPEWQFDINFPRPRIARRIAKRGAMSESWIYTGVGLGGNTWAVEREDDSHGVLTLRDYQWIFGWESLRSGGRGWFVEGGAAFGRTLEYEETDEEVDFDDALFVRLGINL